MKWPYLWCSGLRHSSALKINSWQEQRPMGCWRLNVTGNAQGKCPILCIFSLALVMYQEGFFLFVYLFLAKIQFQILVIEKFILLITEIFFSLNILLSVFFSLGFYLSHDSGLKFNIILVINNCTQVSPQISPPLFCSISSIPISLYILFAVACKPTNGSKSF